MKVITNSTGTKAFGVGSEVTAVILDIYSNTNGFTLRVMISGMSHLDFETGDTLEEVQAKAAPIIAALEE